MFLMLVLCFLLVYTQLHISQILSILLPTNAGLLAPTYILLSDLYLWEQIKEQHGFLTLTIWHLGLENCLLQYEQIAFTLSYNPLI